MSRLIRGVCLATVVAVVFAALSGGLLSLTWTTAQADESVAAEPAPPEGQTYTGSKACAACHFEAFMSWKKTKHSKSFELLPANYQSDPTCLKCHTTGYGQPSGFKDIATTPNLAGTTCETCHGPGSEHEKAVQAFGQKKLSPDEEKIANDTIWRMVPKNICVDCHAVQGHGKSSTPPELR